MVFHKKVDYLWLMSNILFFSTKNKGCRMSVNLDQNTHTVRQITLWQLGGLPQYSTSTTVHMTDVIQFESGVL